MRITKNTFRDVPLKEHEHAYPVLKVTAAQAAILYFLLELYVRVGSTGAVRVNAMQVLHNRKCGFPYRSGCFSFMGTFSRGSCERLYDLMRATVNKSTDAVGFGNLTTRVCHYQNQPGAVSKCDPRLMYAYWLYKILKHNDYL